VKRVAATDFELVVRELTQTDRMVYIPTKQSVSFEEDAMIPNRWYPVLESAKLRQPPVGVKRMGRKLVLWRDAEGRPVAMPSACPHRGAALENGRVVNGQLACPWHGFRFDGGGQCRLMPCEGADARIPHTLQLPVYPLREAHGLIWLWWGEERRQYPEVPFFENLSSDRKTAQASYVLPYHYTRMMETNLDLHHTPFVHGSVIPGLGTRVDPYEARVEGDRILTRGELRKEGAASGMPFRADALLPCLVLIELTPKLRLVVASTPVDDGHTWLWFRYYQDYTALPLLRKLLSWVAVQSELRIVQPQDWRVFRTLPEGTIDDVPYHFVRADLGIALYRRRRSELLAEATHAHAQAG
jgi:phenylpropionate dioxygenase-like ring-hydroxylating dioxygenase large terminal subunit